ncbi:MAG: hypothetical protein VXZ99_09100, partial [Pseudomonadota bacterium]|nr:hypothetical protein [Pseudomonadota bacterium]
LIVAVGAGTLNRSQTAEKIKVTSDALNYYASVESYQEQHISQVNRCVVICPIGEDDCGELARSALAHVFDDI